jgi:hypothetical protein
VSDDSGTGPGLVCPGCGSPDVDLRRGLLCGTCAEAGDCTWEAVFPDVSVPCTLPGGHAGPHLYVPADEEVRYG